MSAGVLARCDVMAVVFKTSICQSELALIVKHNSARKISPEKKLKIEKTCLLTG